MLDQSSFIYCRGPQLGVQWKTKFVIFETCEKLQEELSWFQMQVVIFFFI